MEIRDVNISKCYEIDMCDLPPIINCCRFLDVAIKEDNEN
jgi:hypothetical protein